MRSMVTKRTRFLLLVLWLTTPPAFAITYHTVDVPAAVGGTFGLVDGLFAIRGDATDFDLTPFFPPQYANPNGSLSASFTSYNPPSFDARDYNQFFTGTAVWDNFVVSGNKVSVQDFSVQGEITQTSRPLLPAPYTDGAFFSTTNTGVGESFSFNLADRSMNAQWTARSTYTGPGPGVNPTIPADWIGSVTEVDITSTGAYLINQPGLDTASADQFASLASVLPAQAAADYLNLVKTFVPNDWTSVGIWFYGLTHNSTNSRGFFSEPQPTSPGTIIGGSVSGISAWYSTDSFIYGQEIEDENGDGFFSNEEVAALVAMNKFPEVAGLNLAGNGFAQLYEVALIEGVGGTEQTIVFDYDDSVISAEDELLLAILHYTNGAWEKPNQVLNTAANQISVTVDNFSPFALVTVPLPPAVYLFGVACVALFGRFRKRH